MHRRTLGICAATTLIVGCTVAPSAGSGPRGESNGSAVGGVAAEALSRYAMYGLSGAALVEIDGRVVAAQEMGLANRERGQVVSDTTRFDVGSITKTFTAAAILRLVDAGRLRLTDSLGMFFAGAPPVRSRLTIHRLLTHTGGFPLDPSDAGIAPTDDRAAFIAKALRHADSTAKIGEYSYSNLGYGVLALIVEQVSGRSFREFVNGELIAPAGLRRTSWWNDPVALDVPNVAVGYVFSDRGETLAPEPPFQRGGPSSPVWGKWPLGAGGVVSTTRDLRTWWHALYDDGLLSASMKQHMFSMQDSTGNQGYGWTILRRPQLGLRIHRGGSRTGFNSMLAAYPDRRALIVFAINQSVDAQWQSFVWTSLERILLGEAVALPPATTSLSPAQLADLTGVFRMSPSAAIRVDADGSELLVGAEGQDAIDEILNRGTPISGAVERNAAADRVVTAIVRGEPTDSSVPRPLASQLASWLTDRTRAGRHVILGTEPHPSGAGRMQTFVRFGDAQSSTVARLVWDRGRVVAYGDGVRFPAFKRYRPISPTRAVAFSPRDTAWTTLEIVARAGKRALTIERRDGSRTRAATAESRR